MKKVIVSHQSPGYREEFWTLTADKTVKQGAYQKYAASGNHLQTSGYYTNNQKDSLWVEYYADGETMRERGTYHQGQKVGMWEYYTPEGTLEQNYDHTYRQVLFSKPAANDRRVFKLWNDDPESCRDTLQLQTRPVYIGGAEAFQAALRQNLHYPATALKNQTSGTAWVGFTIDAEGHPTDYRILKPLGGSLDAEALRAVKLIPPTWTPGRLDGSPVAVVCEVPVAFAPPTAPARPRPAAPAKPRGHYRRR